MGIEDIYPLSKGTPHTQGLPRSMICLDHYCIESGSHWFWREVTKTGALFPSESFLSPHGPCNRHSFVVTKTEIHQRIHVMSPIIGVSGLEANM